MEHETADEVSSEERESSTQTLFDKYVHHFHDKTTDIAMKMSNLILNITQNFRNSRCICFSETS